MSSILQSTQSPRPQPASPKRMPQTKMIDQIQHSTTQIYPLRLSLNFKPTNLPIKTNAANSVITKPINMYQLYNPFKLTH
jgi:hypothetical protein